MPEDQEIKIKKSTDFTMFVPAFIDEYGFSPAQFRLFARIMRRSLGDDGKQCYETVQRLSLNLGISKRVVQESLKILERAKCIRIIRREGSSNLISFRPCGDWVSKQEFDAINYEVTGKRIQRDRERKMTPGGNATRSGNALPPSAETHHKGNPYKGTSINKNSEQNGNRSIEPMTETLKNPSSPEKEKSSAPPAVLAVREVCKRFPPKPIWHVIQDAIGDTPDIDRLQKTYEGWVLNGFKPTNYAWATDWYPKGITSKQEAYQTEVKKTERSYNYVHNQPTQREAIAAEQEMLAKIYESTTRS